MILNMEGDAMEAAVAAAAAAVEAAGPATTSTTTQASSIKQKKGTSNKNAATSTTTTTTTTTTTGEQPPKEPGNTSVKAKASSSSEAAAEGGGGGGDEENKSETADEEGQEGRIHRSLPRIKAILEDETYLSGILNILEQAGCANYPFASTSNGWMTAFHNIYASVAVDCHHPIGKNRHHKFKDKMVEIWNAMESEIASGNHTLAEPLYALGMKQLEVYRNVTRDTEETRNLPRGRNSLPPPPPTAAAAAKSKKGDTADASGTTTTLTTKPTPASPPRRGRPRLLKTKHASSSSSSSSTPGRIVSGEALMQVVRRLDRLEAIALDSLPDHTSKLFTSPTSLSTPSLNELHQLYLQNQRRSAATRNVYEMQLQPYYEAAVKQFLQKVTQLATTSNDARKAKPSWPSDLFKSLQDVEVLMRAHPTTSVSNTADETTNISTSSLASLIHDTYKLTLDAYLKRVNPQVAAQLEEAAAAERDRKRAAEETDDDDDDDFDEAEEGDDDEEAGGAAVAVVNV